MENYSFGNVDIEFKTNKIFLLMQMLYRWDRIENKINDEDNALSHLAKLMENFKKILAENDEGLKEFNVYKYNAEYNDMWAEYGKYIENFAQIDIEEIRIKNPQMAKAIEELMKTDFFKKVEDINNQYSKKMEKRFMEQTRGYKTEADDIVGKTKVRKIIYMPFDPDLIDIQPMYLTDKNENGEYAVQFSIPTDKEKFKELLKTDDIFAINRATESMRSQDIDYDRFAAIVEYMEDKSAKAIETLAWYADKFEFIRGTVDYETIGRYALENDLPEDAEAFFDYKGYGKHIEEAYAGKFLKKGFVYPSDPKVLEQIEFDIGCEDMSEDNGFFNNRGGI